MALVVDASVGLKWLLQEEDSDLAQALAAGDEELCAPDFWLHDACNVIWLQVHRHLLTADEAREGLSLLRAQLQPTSTTRMGLHEVALEMAITADHPCYDTMYVAFAIAVGARGVVTADAAFVRAMRRHPDPAIANLLIALSDWAMESRAGPP